MRRNQPPQPQRPPIELEDVISGTVFIPPRAKTPPDHLEPEPCKGCEAKDKQIEELRFLLYDTLENLKSYRNGDVQF